MVAASRRPQMVPSSTGRSRYVIRPFIREGGDAPQRVAGPGRRNAKEIGNKKFEGLRAKIRKKFWKE